MQEIVGWVIIAIIIIISACLAYDKAENEFRGKWSIKIIYTLKYFCLIYLGIGATGALIWIFAWVGIKLRYATQWFIEAIISPFIF